MHHGHLFWRPILLPASFLPVTRTSGCIHRACEPPADNYGAACCSDVEDGVRGLSALAAGGRRWQDLNLPEYLQQTQEAARLLDVLHELIADYPWLVKRVARVAAQSDGDRHVAAVDVLLGYHTGNANMLVPTSWTVNIVSTTRRRRSPTA